MHDHAAILGVSPEAAVPAVHGELESLRMGQSAIDSARPGACGSAADADRGDGLSEYARRSIYADAERASKLGQSILDACPYNAWEPEGKLWRQVWRLAEAAKGVE